MINYAHRGASEYAPENTMSAFYMGLAMGANGIETDIRKTKDGQLVLFHDGTLDRVTNKIGGFHDFTWQELKALLIKGKSMAVTEDCMVRFEDFLRYFHFRNITIALELKDENIETDVLELLSRFSFSARVEITSFCFENLKRMRALDKNITLGYLVDTPSDEVVNVMRSIDGTQICPKGSSLTKERVLALKRMGFNVRAWGITDETVMRYAADCKVDGMTVNFPDKLAAYEGQ